MKRVLVIPGGTEIGLEIGSALQAEKSFCLFSAGSGDNNHAPFFFSRHTVLPSIREAGFIEALQLLIVEQGIDYIFPAYDDVQLYLAERESQLGAALISPPLEACLVTRRKSLTYRKFAKILPVPRLYKSGDEIDFPVFVKPDVGQGAQDTNLCRTVFELRAALAKTNEPLICEFLPGEEVTVDCFSDRTDGLLFCRGRKRVRVRAGISVAAAALHEPEFERLGFVIHEQLGMRGAWFFQLKKDAAGNWKLLEIGPRIAGGMAFHRVQGVNFPLLSIYEMARVKIALRPQLQAGLVMDRAFKNRFNARVEFSTAYVDFDDTLLLDQGRLNLDLLVFLFQCIHKRKRICLLTKHAGNLNQKLSELRISSLFDEVLHIAKTDSKADYIMDPDSIFIDDSFSERMKVHTLRGIPTFDCSTVELLIDRKV